MTQLTEYRCKEGFFANSYVFKSVDRLSPTVWWKGTCFCLKLSVIALAILEMPPTTAATERTFSTQGFIHSSKRNRLTTDRAAQLTFISYNLKIMKRKDCNKYSSHKNNDNSHNPDHENTLNNENQSNVNLESYQSTNSLDLDNSLNIEYGQQQNIIQVSENDTVDTDTYTSSSSRFNSSKYDKPDSFNFSLNGDDNTKCNNDNIYSNDSLLNILNIASTSKSSNSYKTANPLKQGSNNSIYISTPKKPVSKKTKFQRLIILSDDEEDL